MLSRVVWWRLNRPPGYGQSSKPKGSDSHAEYSKKEMASDQVQVMSVAQANSQVHGADVGGAPGSISALTSSTS